ncbi:thioredoxin-like protein [Xylariales sp. PMI_506]|nr:thioredoxin-like protein [Xylariales sp. PMI_506]
MAEAHPSSDTITTVTSAAEFDKLLKENKYVVTDFHASWCGPCKAMSPLFSKHAAAHHKPGTVAFAEVDVDAVPDVAARYRVTTIPTFLFVRDGEAYDELRTASPPKLQNLVSELVAEVAKADDVAGAIKDEDW